MQQEARWISAGLAFLVLAFVLAGCLAAEALARRRGANTRQGVGSVPLGAVGVMLSLAVLWGSMLGIFSLVHEQY